MGASCGTRQKESSGFVYHVGMLQADTLSNDLVPPSTQPPRAACGFDDGGDDKATNIFSTNTRKLKLELIVQKAPKLPCTITGRWVAVNTSGKLANNTQLYASPVPVSEVPSTLTYRVAYKKDWAPGQYELEIDFDGTHVHTVPYTLK